MTNVSILDVMGVSDGDLAEVEEDVESAINSSATTQVFLAKLREKYDGKAMLVGMRALQMLMVNDRLTAEGEIAKKSMARSPAFSPSLKPNLN